MTVKRTFQVTAGNRTMRITARDDADARRIALRRLAAPRPGDVVRDRRTNPHTGADVILCDTHADGSHLDPDGGRWATVCETHGSVVNHDTLKRARGFLTVPWEWCEVCDEQHRGT